MFLIPEMKKVAATINMDVCNFFFSFRKAKPLLYDVEN
jgi:hypothetical protein